MVRRCGPNRYRRGGRGSERVQQGGFTTPDAARKALEAALERVCRAAGTARTPTLSEQAAEYLDQHQAEPKTVDKLRWLLSKSLTAFGATSIDELKARDIAAWRMTLPNGHRFEATQALRQTLARAVSWELIATNPAKVGVDNPVPVRREQRPLESWEDLRLLARALGPRYGPMILFAAATGLRPGEWTALEHRDIDLIAGVVLVAPIATDGSRPPRRPAASAPSRCNTSVAATLEHDDGRAAAPPLRNRREGRRVEPDAVDEHDGSRVGTGRRRFSHAPAYSVVVTRVSATTRPR